MKSIRKAVEKYDGSVVFGVQQNWFELKILLPRYCNALGIFFAKHTTKGPVDLF